MENHHFSWENQLLMAIFNSYVKLQEGKHAYVQPQTYPKNDKILEQISNHRTREQLVWTAIKGSWAKTSPNSMEIAIFAIQFPFTVSHTVSENKPQSYPTIPTYPKTQITKSSISDHSDHGILGSWDYGIHQWRPWRGPGRQKPTLRQI